MTFYILYQVYVNYKVANHRHTNCVCESVAVHLFSARSVENFKHFQLTQTFLCVS